LFVQALAAILLVAIFVRIIFSFFPSIAPEPISSVVYEITEPILAPIRQVIPGMMGFDFSPMVAAFILIIIFNASNALSR